MHNTLGSPFPMQILLTDTWYLLGGEMLNGWPY